MKKLFCILGLMLLCSHIAFAEEVVSSQEINSDSNKAVIAIQKQPLNEKSIQKQDLKNNWFCIVVQCNGKVADIDKK